MTVKEPHRNDPEKKINTVMLLKGKSVSICLHRFSQYILDCKKNAKRTVTDGVTK